MWLTWVFTVASPRKRVAPILDPDAAREDDIVFTYSTSGGSQVWEVPAGGARLGGGSTSASETPWLVGTGAVAAVGESGLLVARRRSATP